MRMESRRQVTVSWDSGGSDEAPPKVAIRTQSMSVSKNNDNTPFNSVYFFQALSEGLVKATTFCPIPSSSANACLK